MQVLGSSITSRVILRGKPDTANHFFYLSPALFARQGALTQREGERIKNTEDTALPSRISALEGVLTIDVNKDRLKGRVTMIAVLPKAGVSEGRPGRGLPEGPSGTALPGGGEEAATDAWRLGDGRRDLSVTGARICRLGATIL